MNARLTVRCIRTILGSAAACALFAADASAKDHDVTVAIHVSVGGLDLNRPADAHTFYARLQNAASVACTHGNRVDLAPVDDLRGCYEKALAGAVRSARAPMLTQIYLESH